jgi:hypothetical protein
MSTTTKKPITTTDKQQSLTILQTLFAAIRAKHS